MLKADQIPDEAMNALLRALQLRKGGREALAAALNAWPNATTTSWFENSVRKAVLNIPLPQEVSDE